MALLFPLALALAFRLRFLDRVDVLLLRRELREAVGCGFFEASACSSYAVDPGLKEVPTDESARVPHQVLLQRALRQHAEGHADSDVRRDISPLVFSYLSTSRSYFCAMRPVMPLSKEKMRSSFKKPALRENMDGSGASTSLLQVS